MMPQAHGAPGPPQAPASAQRLRFKGDLHATAGVSYEARDIAIENCKFVGW